MDIGRVPLTIDPPHAHSSLVSFGKPSILPMAEWHVPRPRVRPRTFAINCSVHAREGGTGILTYHSRVLDALPESLFARAHAAACAKHPQWKVAFELRALYGPLPRGRFQELRYESGKRALIGVLKVDAYRVAQEWGYLAVFYHPGHLGWITVLFDHEAA